MSKYVRAARCDFGYPNKIHVEFGLINVNGFRLALPSNSQPNFSGEIFDDVKVSTTIDGPTETAAEEALLKIFQAVHDAAGEMRP